MPTISFDLTSRFRGHVDEAGQTYAFTIKGDEVDLRRMLTRERGGFAFRDVPARHKAALRAAILAAYRAAAITPTEAIAAMSAAVDRVEACQ